jgi:hypothetical protein
VDKEKIRKGSEEEWKNGKEGKKRKEGRKGRKGRMEVTKS